MSRQATARALGPAEAVVANDRDDTWSSIELALLASMRAEGRSYLQCSLALPGRSRNACISKAWRMSLPAPSNGPEDPNAIIARAKTTALRIADWSEPADVIAIPSAGKPLIDLALDECRWPFGEGLRMRFCGSPTGQGETYCAGHEALAYAPRNTACGHTHRSAGKPGDEDT